MGYGGGGDKGWDMEDGGDRGGNMKGECNRDGDTEGGGDGGYGFGCLKYKGGTNQNYVQYCILNIYYPIRRHSEDTST